MSTTELDSRFRIRAPLRCDGVGSLDCAEDIESGVRMAIRWLPVDANGEAAVKAVEEIPSHPVLPRIRGTGRVGSAAYVAMEFPEGRLLSTMMDAPLPADVVIRMGSAVADALALLHQQSVVHGELSSDSVLMLPEDKAILWDVPLVTANRLTDRRGEERELAQLIRVAPYLSPERARGLPASAHSDVYALASVMCFAAGGLPPHGGTTLAVVHQIANGQWTPELPRGLPPPVRELMAKMLCADPLSRPTAAQVAQWLSAHVQQTPTIPEMPAVLDPAPYAVLSPPPLPKKAEAPAPAPVVESAPVAPAPTDPQVAPPVVVAETPSVVLEPELEAAAQQLRKVARQRLLLALGAVSACALIAAIVVAVFVGSSSSEEAVTAPVEIAQPTPAPLPLTDAPAAKVPDVNVESLVAPLISPRQDEVADRAVALSRAAQQKKARTAPARNEPKVASAANAQQPAEAQPAEAVEVEEAPTAQEADFAFLPSSVPAPTSELKRPDF